MRRLTEFACAGETLAGTLDAGAAATGLLIVSGGSEIRIGAHRGMATLAQEIAAAGYPVLRYDRRGIGDSTGENMGFEGSADDIAAAAAAFRAEQPQLARIVAFGNCDAATALAFHHDAAGIDALVLANPWTIETVAGDASGDGMPPAAAIRARYARKLLDPREWLRLLGGGVDMGKLARGVAKASRRGAGGLGARLATALAGARVPVTILLAARDNTAIAFRAACRAAPVATRDTASHSFAAPGDAEWLRERLLEVLSNQSR